MVIGANFALKGVTHEKIDFTSYASYDGELF